MLHDRTLLEVGLNLSKRCAEYVHLFLRRNPAATEQNLEPNKIIELCPMTLSEPLAKVKSGEVLDSKTQLGLLQAQLSCMENA